MPNTAGFLNLILCLQRTLSIFTHVLASIGESSTAWYYPLSSSSSNSSSPVSASPAQSQMIRELLCAFGSEVLVSKEDHIDVATSIAASGVAFVLLYMESMIDEAVRLGMTRPHAQQLISQAFKGAGSFCLCVCIFFNETTLFQNCCFCFVGMLAQQLPIQHCAVLRSSIVSPGGTTAVVR